MAIKRRRKSKRRIKVSKTQETATERQMRTAVQVILDSPHSNTIIKWIRKGIPNSVIAEQAINRDMFDLTQKTLVGYLQYFRRAQPGMCKPQEPAAEDANIAGYDHLFDANQAIVDEETELLRLIELQKARLGIGFTSERSINMLMQSNRREVEELRNLLMDLAKLRGKTSNGFDVNVNNYNPNVVDDLKGITQDERSRNVIATLVGDLAKVSS